MSSSPADISPERLQDILQLEQFLHALKRAGFAVFPEHFLEVPVLVDTLIPEYPFEDLKSILCPLFVRDEEEQQRFYAFFDQYFTLKYRAAGSDALSKKKPEPTPEKAPETKKVRAGGMVGRVVSFLLAGAALVALCGGAVYLLSFFFEGREQAFGTWGLIGLLCAYLFIAFFSFGFSNALLTLLAGAFKWKMNQRISNYWMGLCLLIPIVLILIFNEYFSLQLLLPALKDIGLGLLIIGAFYALIFFFSSKSKNKESESPLNQRISRKAPLRFTPDVPLPEFDLLNKGDTFQILRSMNKQQADTYNTREIDIPETLDRTIRNAGMIEIAYRPAVSQPQYLLLIDKANRNRHQIEWFDYILTILQNDGTKVELYYYDYDPSLAWEESEKDAVPLQNLYAGQRLIMLTDGHSLVHRVSGGLTNWMLDLLSLWSEKALLSPVPVEDWGYTEQQLDTEFSIAPSTIEGLLDTIAYFDNLNDTSLDEWHQIDRYDLYNSNRIELLQKGLPELVFQWICACAVYPELHWRLTLYLGDILEGDTAALLNRENLTIISRLKWFQAGKIPDEIRVRLIALLPGELEQRIRRELLAILERPGSVPPETSYAYRKYRLAYLRNRFALSESESEKEQLYRELQIMVLEQGANDGELESLLKKPELQNKYGLVLEEIEKEEISSKGRISISNVSSTNTQKDSLQWILFQGKKMYALRDHLLFRVKKANKILVLLPGLKSDRITFTMTSLARVAYLQNQFDLVLLFESSSNRTNLEAMAERLRKSIERLEIKPESEIELTLLANSDGGLVARYYIEQLGGNEVVDHLIMAGTPNAGSEWFGFFLIESVARMAGAAPFLKPIIRSVYPFYRQISAQNTFLKNLNQSEDPGVPYSIIAGIVENLSPESAGLSEAARKVLKAGKAKADQSFKTTRHDLGATVESITAIDPSRVPPPMVKEVSAIHNTYFEQEESVRVILEILNRDLKEERVVREIENAFFLYALPDEMEVGSEYRIVVRIATNENDLRTDLETAYSVKVAKVPFTRIMSAEIFVVTDQKEPGLIIKPLNETEQEVAPEGYTEWVNILAPELEGSAELLLQVGTIAEGGGEEKRREYNIEEKIIVREAQSPQAESAQSQSRTEERSFGDIEAQERLPSRWVFASGQQEVVSDGSKEGLSSFTASMLDVLEANEKEKLRFTEFANSVIDRVVRMASQTPLYGPLRNTRHEGGEFIFKRKDDRLGRQQATRKMQQNISVEYTPEGPGRTFLLAIGIDQYESSRIQPLNSAVRDATSLISLLLESYHFEESNLITLFDRQAMRENIMETLIDLTKKLGPEDDLLIFFAGHSIDDPELEASYWMPHDADRTDLNSAISHESLLNYFRRMNCRHLLLITDTAFSGTLIASFR